MVSSNDKPSDQERRTSLRQSVRISASVDEDDFALAAMGVSDGFRPPQEPIQQPTPVQDDSQTASEPARQVPDIQDYQSQRPPSRPSSIAKTRHNESFSLRHDGQTGAINGPLRPRTSTASSVNPFIAAESQPYSGPSGPSFPYQMYPQNVRSNRTASVATSSTAAHVSERSYNGPRGPTHPYGMYPQNTVSDGDGIAGSTQPIPVGFPGNTDQYRRRIGPDGEEVADLIGPDGHTEELPPYTRYATETYVPKPHDQGTAAASIQPMRAQPLAQVHDAVAVAPQPQQQSSSTTPAPITVTTAVPPAIAGAGGLGLATRNPEFSSSTDDLGSARSRFSAQSFASQASSHEINTAANAAANNEKEKPAWRRKAEKRAWGIVPYWAICLVFTVLVLMGVILGAVIGTFLAKKPPPHKEPEAAVTAFPATVTVTLDATPLSTAPSDLRDLEEGDFSLPIVAAARSSKSCFNNTLQSNAWSCTIVFSQLMMSVNRIEGNPELEKYSVNLSCNQSLTLDSGTYSYGTQPPCFNENRTMELVTDIYEQNRGPAWFFQMPYEKVVILPESFLGADDQPDTSSAETLLKERFGGDDRFGSDEFKRKGVANPGEKPWICTWDGTMLEVFVFANQDSNSYRGYTSMSALGASYLATATENPFAHTSPSSSPTPTPSPDKPVTQEGEEGSVHILDSDETTTTITATTTITNPIGSQTTDPNASTTYGQWDMGGPRMPPAPYPRVVKIEERRMNGPPSKVPICKQWEITESGRQPALDESGREIVIEIGETEPDPTPVDADDLFPDETTTAVAEDQVSKSKRRARVDAKEIERRTGGAYYLDEHGHLRERGEDVILVGQDLSDCGCLWWTL